MVVACRVFERFFVFVFVFFFLWRCFVSILRRLSVPLLPNSSAFSSFGVTSVWTTLRGTSGWVAGKPFMGTVTVDAPIVYIALTVQLLEVYCNFVKQALKSNECLENSFSKLSSSKADQSLNAGMTNVHDMADVTE